MFFILKLLKNICRYAKYIGNWIKKKSNDINQGLAELFTFHWKCYMNEDVEAEWNFIIQCTLMCLPWPGNLKFDN